MLGEILQHMPPPHNMYQPPGAADREFGLYLVGFLVSKLVWMAQDNPQDPFGPTFRTKRRFSTHVRPNLMFLERTGTLVNQDWTWAEAWANLGLRPTLDDLGLRLGPILDQTLGRPWADFGRTFGRLLVN